MACWLEFEIVGSIEYVLDLVNCVVRGYAKMTISDHTLITTSIKLYNTKAAE